MLGKNKMKACNEIGNTTRARPDVWVYETLTYQTKNFIRFLAKVACFELGKPDYGFRSFRDSENWFTLFVFKLSIDFFTSLNCEELFQLPTLVNKWGKTRSWFPSRQCLCEYSYMGTREER
jgi:hypothetical protein